MSPGPDDRRSTGATVTIIAAVVVCLFVLGALILVGIGLLFLSVPSGPITGPATVLPPMESVMEPSTPDTTEAVKEDTGDPAVSGETTPAVGATGDSEMPGEVDSPEPAPAETPKPTVVELATLTPSETLSIDVRDSPLVCSVEIDGQTTPRVLWAQPLQDQGVSQLAFTLKEQYANFKGAAAISDAVQTEDAETPSATFNIYGDGNLLWTSDALKGYGVSRAFEISVENIKLLTLVVESDSSSKASRCVWANARLTRIPTE